VIQPEVAEFFRGFSEKIQIDPETIDRRIIEGVEDDIYDEMVKALGYCDDPACDVFFDTHRHGPICHMNCGCKVRRHDS
jgi:hypothetical protein